MQRAVVGMIAKLRFGNEPSLPSWKSRHDFHGLHQHRGIVGMGKPLNRHHLVAWSDGDVKIVILEEKALAGIAGGKGKPQAIPAIGPDARGAETVAIGLDMDVPRLRSPRHNTGDPGRNGCTGDQNRQRQKAADRKIAGFRGRVLSLAVKYVRGVSEDGKEIGVQVHANRRCPIIPSPISPGSFQVTGPGISPRR